MFEAKTASHPSLIVFYFHKVPFTPFFHRHSLDSFHAHCKACLCLWKQQIIYLCHIFLLHCDEIEWCCVIPVSPQEIGPISCCGLSAFHSAPWSLIPADKASLLANLSPINGSCWNKETVNWCCSVKIGFLCCINSFVQDWYISDALVMEIL